MRLSTLRAAHTAANVFIARAKLLMAEVSEEERRRGTTSVDSHVTGSALSGSVKRASMELTRALAKMRKP